MSNTSKVSEHIKRATAVVFIVTFCLIFQLFSLLLWSILFFKDVWLLLLLVVSWMFFLSSDCILGFICGAVINPGLLKRGSSKLHHRLSLTVSVKIQSVFSRLTRRHFVIYWVCKASAEVSLSAAAVRFQQIQPVSTRSSFFTPFASFCSRLHWRNLWMNYFSNAVCCFRVLQCSSTWFLWDSG